MEFLKSIFSGQKGDYITAVDERNTILIKALAEGEGYDMQ